MTKAGFQYYNYFELFLAFSCFFVIVFNITVFIRKKVHQSYSSTTIVLAFTLLLIARIGCMLFYIICQNKLAPLNYLLLSSLATDLPTYLVMNITLALIWQWWRIAKMLTTPQKEIAAIKSGKP